MPGPALNIKVPTVPWNEQREIPKAGLRVFVSWQTLFGLLSITPMDLRKEKSRKHMKAGLIPRVVGDVFGISVSTRTCQVFLNSLVWNLWICVFTHPGSASASQGRKLRGFRAQRSLHGTTAWLWDGSGTWMSTKPPSRMACDLRAEPVRHCNLGTLGFKCS